MKIRFIEDYTPKDGSGRSYAAGQEIEAREDAARHFIARRKAEAVNGEIAPPPAPQAPEISFTDKAEAVNEKRRGRKPAAVAGHNTAFERGEDE